MLNNNKCVWDALKESTTPVILYGMGNGADKVLDEMEKRHIKAAGVMASDDFCRYQAYRGFTVQKESDFVHQLGEFSVALCFGSSLPDVTAHIRAVAERHTLLVPNVPVACARLVHSSSCSVAPARNVSAAATSTFLPCLR